MRRARPKADARRLSMRMALSSKVFSALTAHQGQGPDDSDYGGDDHEAGGVFTLVGWFCCGLCPSITDHHFTEHVQADMGLASIVERGVFSKRVREGHGGRSGSGGDAAVNIG